MSLYRKNTRNVWLITWKIVTLHPFSKIRQIKIVEWRMTNEMKYREMSNSRSGSSSGKWQWSRGDAYNVRRVGLSSIRKELILWRFLRNAATTSLSSTILNSTSKRSIKKERNRSRWSKKWRRFALGLCRLENTSYSQVKHAQKFFKRQGSCIRILSAVVLSSSKNRRSITSFCQRPRRA